MFIIKMAFRNIFRQKRRSVLTALSMTVGFFLACLFIGWADGAYNNIIDTFTRSRLGHIQIHEKTYLDRPSLYKTIDDVANISSVLNKTKQIVSWTPRLFSAGLTSVGDKSSGTRIIGIDPARENATTGFEAKIKEGKSLSGEACRQAVLAQGLATILDAGLNDELVILTQAADGSIANDLYTVVGILSSGNDISDRTDCYLHLKDAQELLVLEGRVHEIAVTVGKLSQVKAVTASLTREIDDPGLAVVPWQIFARSFYQAMQADKEGMWIMLLIIVIVVAVGVLNTVLMSVLERRREYGVLKAVGTRPKQIVRLVLAEVIILSLFCIVIGSGLGLAANSYMSDHGITLSKGLTYGGMEFGTMKSEVNLRSFLIPTFTVLLVAALVSLVPALKAARTDAARTMRTY